MTKPAVSPRRQSPGAPCLVPQTLPSRRDGRARGGREHTKTGRILFGKRIPKMLGFCRLAETANRAGTRVFGFSICGANGRPSLSLPLFHHGAAQKDTFTKSLARDWGALSRFFKEFFKDFGLPPQGPPGRLCAAAGAPAAHAGLEELRSQPKERFNRSPAPAHRVELGRRRPPRRKYLRRPGSFPRSYLERPDGIERRRCILAGTDRKL
jgi:hypothetical protein